MAFQIAFAYFVEAAIPLSAIGVFFRGDFQHLISMLN
jgi:hypothetical protein